MIWDVATLVAFITRSITLEPGDVIATGTPAGVGHYHDPPRYLAAGDVMACEIAGIGVLENTIVDEQPRAGRPRRAAGVGDLMPGPRPRRATDDAGPGQDAAGAGARDHRAPVPTPGPGEVQLRIEAASVCGTDRHLYLWDRGRRRTSSPRSSSATSWPAGWRRPGPA